jgi:hypothetical protein
MMAAAAARLLNAFTAQVEILRRIEVVRSQAQAAAA